MRTLIYLVLVSFIPVLSFADDYLWRFDGGPVSLRTHPGMTTVTESCERARAYYSIGGAGGYNYNSVVDRLVPVPDRSGRKAYLCQLRRADTGALLSPLYLLLYGQCASPNVVNPQTGACEPPEPDVCEPTAGRVTTHQHLRGPVGGPVVEPPLTICENACQYTFTYKVLDVYRFVNPSPDQLDNSYGKYEYQGNGTSCTESDDPQNGSVFDQPPAQPPMDKTPEYARDNICDQWVTNPDGTRSRSCTAKEEFKQPGTIDCVAGWQSSACKAGNPPPEYTKTETTENTTETTNPDGSKKTDTTKTTDKTTCKGVKPCTSTSKTETGTSETDADGKPGNESGTCTGTGCKPGEGEKDGDKESEGEEEGEEEERTATVGECDAPVSCSGDAIDCAILQQQKEQRCLAEEMSDYAGKKSDIEGLFEGEQFDLQEGQGDIEVPSLIRQGTRFLPATCPQDKSFNLRTAGGRTFALSFEPLCQAASDLSGLFVAVATVLAALYVGRSVGGN